jgi:hypothetical protein
LYLSKYFNNALKVNDILMPVLFRAEHIIELFYSMVNREAISRRKRAVGLRSQSVKVHNVRKQEKGVETDAS